MLEIFLWQIATVVSIQSMVTHVLCFKKLLLRRKGLRLKRRSALLHRFSSRKNRQYTFHVLLTTYTGNDSSGYCRDAIRVTSNCLLQSLLHYASCLAILLRHKLQARLQSVTCLAVVKPRIIFAARSIARSRIRFYFLQRLPQRCNSFYCTLAIKTRCLKIDPSHH